jgi:hypothetical protein
MGTPAEYLKELLQPTAQPWRKSLPCNNSQENLFGNPPRVCSALQAERAAFMARVLEGKTHQVDPHTHFLSHKQDLNVVLNNTVVYV